MDESSKNRKVSNTKTIDLSNILPLHTATKTVPTCSSLKIHAHNQIIHNSIHNKKIKDNENELEEDGAGEIFGEILKRARGVSRSSSGVTDSTRIEKQKSLVNVKALSMSIRRSTSVAQGYCKIYDQSDDNAEDNSEKLRTSACAKSCKKKGGKFLRGWWRVFGF